MGVKETFGRNLRFARKKANLSQEKLAEKIEISTNHLSRIETGKAFVSADLLERISQVLKTPISSLFFTEREKTLDESDLSKIRAIIREEADKMRAAAERRLNEIFQ